MLIEQESNYVAVMQDEARHWSGVQANQVQTINCLALDGPDISYAHHDA